VAEDTVTVKRLASWETLKGRIVGPGGEELTEAMREAYEALVRVFDEEKRQLRALEDQVASEFPEVDNFYDSPEAMAKLDKGDTAIRIETLKRLTQMYEDATKHNDVGMAAMMAFGIEDAATELTEVKDGRAYDALRYPQRRNKNGTTGRSLHYQLWAYEARHVLDD
jgi:hypothetical protein